MDAEKRHIGRPTMFSAELAERICELAANGHTIKEISETIGCAPSSIATWQNKYPFFAENLARAQDVGFDVQADDLLKIADNTPDVHRARLKSDNVKWYLRVRNPKKFGDRIDVNLQQQVSVLGALEAAEKRLVRPVRDQLDIEDAQVIEPQQITEQGHTDQQTVDLEQNAEDLLS